MPRKTKTEVTKLIGDAVTKFERDYMGRGPDSTVTYIIDDMVLVRFDGVLTPGERELATTDDRGRALIKQMRDELLEKGRTHLEQIIWDITGNMVKSLHTDISTRTGERVIIFTLDGPVRLRDG